MLRALVATTTPVSRHFRSLLAQFGLTPKSKRGLASSDPGAAVDPLAWGMSPASDGYRTALGQIGEESTG